MISMREAVHLFSCLRVPLMLQVLNSRQCRSRQAAAGHCNRKALLLGGKIKQPGQAFNSIHNSLRILRGNPGWRGASLQPSC